MNNIPYLLALHSINGLGPIRLKAILNYFKDPRLAWEADRSEIRKLGIPQATVELLLETRKKLKPVEYAQSIKDSGISWLTIFDEGYPDLLKAIYDPPTVIYYKGTFPIPGPSIGVVGTRKISGYGRVVTNKFCDHLARNRVNIVSGLARGVDTEAAQSALAAGGKTVAVLGGGLNKIYPSENTGLAVKITHSGGAVISEFVPDQQSLPGNFPARNRIISGLSLAVLLTEAAEDSGSLITAREALEQGREVFAVPGPITSEGSQGTLLLIKQGATLVSKPEEILAELGLDRIKNPELGIRNEEFKLTGLEKQVLELLSSETRHLDEICRELQVSTAEVSASLIKMEIAGLVKNLGSGNYLKA